MSWGVLGYPGVSWGNKTDPISTGSTMVDRKSSRHDRKIVDSDVEIVSIIRKTNQEKLSLSPSR